MYNCFVTITNSGIALFSVILRQMLDFFTACEYISTSDFEHGTMDFSGYTAVNDSITFLCTAGYVLEGEPILVCKKSGNWSHPIPTCGMVADYE